MKSLLLLRHASAANSQKDLSDFERPLTVQGRHAATLVGCYLRSENISLDALITSTAVRARETTELVLSAAALTCDIFNESRIYEASVDTLLSVISEQDDKHETLLLVGHNPGLEQLLGVLTGRAIGVGTANLASVTLNIEGWTALKAGAGTLRRIVTPAELQQSQSNH